MEHSKTRGWEAYVGVGLLVAALLGVYFVYPIRVVVLVSLLTLFFAVVLAAPVDYLARRGLGRAWGLLAVAAGLFVADLVINSPASVRSKAGRTNGPIEGPPPDSYAVSEPRGGGFSCHRHSAYTP